MSHKKWRRERKAKQDKQQTRFTKTGSVMKPVQVVTVIGQTRSMTEQFACAYCLHIDKLQRFLISTRKGYHRGLAQCPECKNKMRMSTLVATWTPEEYAEYVIGAMLSGFFQKIPYRKWSERLYKLGWSARFWRRYKQLKGEEEGETYREYLERKQKKWAEEQGLV